MIGPILDADEFAGRVCIVSGAKKLSSLRAAIVADTITDVVLDESLARLLAEPA